MNLTTIALDFLVRNGTEILGSAIGGFFLWKIKDMILVDLVGTVAPKLFETCFVSLIERFNAFIEMKKKSKKLPKSWEKAESEIIQGLKKAIQILEK